MERKLVVLRPKLLDLEYDFFPPGPVNSYVLVLNKSKVHRRIQRFNLLDHRIEQCMTVSQLQWMGYARTSD